MKTDILLINGSPRKKGNTSVLLDEINRVLGCKCIRAEIVHLDSMRIAPCRGCLWCQGGDDRWCIQKDDMQALYRRLLACRGLVLASPVYWDGVTAQLKLFIDRLFAMMKWKGAKCKSLISGKQAAMVLVAGGGPKDGLGDSRRMLRTVIKWCGFSFAGQLIVPFVDKPGEVKGKEEVMEKAKRLALKLARK